MLFNEAALSQNRRVWTVDTSLVHMLDTVKVFRFFGVGEARKF